MRCSGLAVTTMLFFGIAGGVPGAWGAGPSAPAAANSEVQEKLKAAVREAAGRLGPLQPWQAKILEEEVLPQYSRFIRDYRQSAGGAVTAEVDGEIIRKYLTLYGPTAVRKGEQKMLVLLMPQSGCEKCAEAGPELKTLLQERLARRSLAPIWLTADDVADRGLTGRPLEERLGDLVQRKNAAGAWTLEWMQLDADSLDSAHADEKHYRIRESLLIRGDRDFRHDTAMDVMAEDSFAAAAARLMTDSLTEIGGKLLLAQMGEGQDNLPETEVAVEGVRDYPHYARLRGAVGEALKSLGTVEERKVSRGRVVFALRGARKAEEVRRALAGVAKAESLRFVDTGDAGAAAPADAGAPGTGEPAIRMTAVEGGAS